MSKAIQNIYEKMLQNPDNRKISRMKQPMPSQRELMGGSSGKEVDTKNVKEEQDDSIDNDFFAAVDRRMAMKKEGKIPDSSSGHGNSLNEAAVKKISKLEARVNELEELVTTMMKTQMKLISRLE